MNAALHVSIVAGEESGDQLGADLVRALRHQHRGEIRLSGLGGQHLQSEGLQTLFDPSEIALVGVSAVVRRIPGIIKRINETAKSIIAGRPDCVIIIDSPDFTHRVAKKVRAAVPEIPIIDYVCPSVWAWRPGRAPRMTGYIDHVLAILPFEPEHLNRLHGPPATYVGHRLANNADVRLAAKRQMLKRPLKDGDVKTLLMLPGSRSSEVNALLVTLGEAVSVLVDRGHRLKLLLPTVANLADRIRAGTAGWAVKPEIIEDEKQKWRAFGEADAALAASGTVLLELALVGVPMVSIYRTDLIMRVATSMITTWSAALPNIISDRVVVPEYYDRMIRPGNLARNLERLSTDTLDRAAQLDGFAEIARRMETIRPSGEIAADVVLDHIRRSPGRGSDAGG